MPAEPADLIPPSWHAAPAYDFTDGDLVAELLAGCRDDKGPYILLDRTFNPAGVGGNEGRESIIVSLYEPKQEGGQQAHSAAKADGYQPKARDLDGDDVPF